MVCFVKLRNCMVLNMNYCSSFCTSNLSAFDSSSDLHNFGPNITVIFIPGALNCSIPVLILQPLYNSSQSSHHDRTRRGRSTQSSSGKLTPILPFDILSFSIEVSQEVTEDSDPSEEVEPQYDCGKSVGTIFNANCTLYIDVQQHSL